MAKCAPGMLQTGTTLTQPVAPLQAAYVQKGRKKERIKDPSRLLVCSDAPVMMPQQCSGWGRAPNQLGLYRVGGGKGSIVGRVFVSGRV